MIKVYGETLERILLLWPVVLVLPFAISFLGFAPIVGYRWATEIFVAVLILPLAIAALARQKQTGITKSGFIYSFVPLVLFTLWSFTSVIWSDSSRGAIHHSLLWSCYVSFYFLVWQLLSQKSQREMLIVAAFITLAVGLACLTEFMGRSPASAKNFNERYYTFAEGVATLIPIFLARFFISDGKLSKVFLIVAVIGWAAILATTSRTILLAALVGFFVFIILGLMTRARFERPRRVAAVIVLLLLVSALVQLPFRSTDYSSTLSRLVKSDEWSATSADSRLLMWGLAVEGFRENPVIGIGGDNYFSNYKELRASLSTRDPSNPVLEINEDVLPERAHNEYLQILAELGLIGGLIFISILSGIGYMFYLAVKRKASLETIAALAGIAAFLVASVASSYSFRFPPSGIIFFFLLAVASHELLANSKPLPEGTANVLSKGFPIFSVAVATSMIAFCVIRANSIRHMTGAINARNQETRLAEIENAIDIDPTEPMFRSYYGQWLSLAGDNGSAIPQLRLAIDNGLANSTSYFNLIAAQRQIGRNENALATFEEALRVYPRSVFLRTAFASFLKQQGDPARGEEEYQKAVAVNAKQAMSWQLAHDEGLEKLVQKARVDSGYLSPFDLKPENGPLVVSNSQRRAQQ